MSRPSSSLALPPELILRSLNNIMPGSPAASAPAYPSTPIQGGPTSFVPLTSFTSQYNPSRGGANVNNQASFQSSAYQPQHHAPQYNSFPSYQQQANQSNSYGQQYPTQSQQQQPPITLNVKTPIAEVLQQLNTHAPANFIPGKQHAQHMTNLLAAAIPSQYGMPNMPTTNNRLMPSAPPKKSNLRLPKSVEDYYQTFGPCVTRMGRFEHVVDIAQSTILGNTPPSAAIDELFESIDLDVTDVDDIDPIFFRIAEFVGGCKGYHDDSRYLQEPRYGIMLIPKVPRDASGKPLVGNLPYSKLRKLDPKDPEEAKEIARRRAITLEIAPYKKFASKGVAMPNMQAAAPLSQQQTFQQVQHQGQQQSHYQGQQSHQGQQQPPASFAPPTPTHAQNTMAPPPTPSAPAVVPDWKMETLSGSGDSDDDSSDTTDSSDSDDDDESGEEEEEEQDESSVEEISTKQLAKRGAAVAKKSSATPPRDRFGLGLFETGFEASTIAMMEQQEIKRRRSKLDEYAALVKTAQHIGSDYIKSADVVEQLDVEELTQLIKDLQDDYDFEVNVWENVANILGKWAPCGVVYTNAFASDFLNLEDAASDEEQVDDEDEEDDTKRPTKKKRDGKYVQSMQAEVKKLKQDTKLKWLRNNRSFDWSSLLNFGMKLTTGTVNRHLSRTYHFELDQPLMTATTGFGTSVAPGLVSDSSMSKNGQVPAKKRYKEDARKLAKEAKRQEKEARRAARQQAASSNSVPTTNVPQTQAVATPSPPESKPIVAAATTRQLLDANVPSSSAPPPPAKELPPAVPQQRTRVSLGDPKVMTRLNNFQ